MVSIPNFRYWWYLSYSIDGSITCNIDVPSPLLVYSIKVYDDGVLVYGVTPSGGQSLVTLGDVTSKEELLARLEESLKNDPPSGDNWLIGFGYDNTKFPDGEHPTKFDLDKISKDIPISVSHASGHLAAVNSKALELYGYVGEDYIVPEGGVVRTVSPDSKEPNGVLEENAILDSEKKKAVKAPGFEEILKARNI